MTTPLCLTVCGDNVTVPVGVETLSHLLHHLGYDGDHKGVAMAHQGVVVPQSRWMETRLSAGDTVEIVRPVFGG